MVRNTDERWQVYLAELESGDHHRSLSHTPKKHERNRVFVESALAAGYTEGVARDHKRKIDHYLEKRMGVGRVLEAYQQGLYASFPEKKPPEKKRRQGLLAGAAAVQEVLPGTPEFGNSAHIGIAKAVGQVGAQAVVYLQKRPFCKNDKEAMLAAGFTEAQAKNPKRLLDSIGKLAGPEILSMLEYYGVDAPAIAETLAHFLKRREMVLVSRNVNGLELYEERERLDGASVNMALTHIQKFMGMGLPGQGEGNLGETLSPEERNRLDQQLAAAGFLGK